MGGREKVESCGRGIQSQNSEIEHLLIEIRVHGSSHLGRVRRDTDNYFNWHNWLTYDDVETERQRGAVVIP